MLLNVLITEFRMLCVSPYIFIIKFILISIICEFYILLVSGNVNYENTLQAIMELHNSQQQRNGPVNYVASTPQRFLSIQTNPLSQQVNIVQPSNPQNSFKIQSLPQNQQILSNPQPVPSNFQTNSRGKNFFNFFFCN